MDNRGFLPYSKCFRSSKHSFSENLEKDKPFLVPLAGKVKTTARFELWVGCLHIPVDDVDSSLWHRCRGPVGRDQAHPKVVSSSQLPLILNPVEVKGILKILQEEKSYM